MSKIVDIFNDYMDKLRELRFASWFEEQRMLTQAVIMLLIAGVILSVGIVGGIAMSDSISFGDLSNPQVFFIDYPDDLDGNEIDRTTLDIVPFPEYVGTTNEAWSRSYGETVDGEHTVHYEEVSPEEGYYFETLRNDELVTLTHLSEQGELRFDGSETTFDEEGASPPYFEPNNRITQGYIWLSVGDWEATGTTTYNGETVIVYETIDIEEGASIDLDHFEGVVYVSTQTVVQSGEEYKVPLMVYGEFEMVSGDEVLSGEYRVEPIGAVTSFEQAADKIGHEV